MTRQSGVTFVLVGLGVLLAGCSLDPYNTGEPGAWHIPDGGALPDGTVTPDASPDACVPLEEVCNGEDDDCDGVIDNGFDLQRDPNNCGTCGHVCNFDHAVSTCEDASCILSACLPGHWDVNGDPSDGCEYQCHKTQDGTEICDGIDNDCDGQVDEDFDLQSDPNNCGACTNVCVFLNGNGACVMGQCTLSSCRGGFVDVDGQPGNGCECRMDLTEDATPCLEGQPGSCGAGEVCADADDDGVSHCAPVPLDLCDGRDNDCDGQVDEDALANLPSTSCYTQPTGCIETSPGVFQCTGTCATGAWTCQNGSMRCVGQVGPSGEVCNEVDDDCNGVVDDGVDKSSDPNNCGACGNACGPLFPHAIPVCAGGVCSIGDCLPGYWDLDPNQPGCEYACTVTNGGVERCGDGLDNDCNGQVDEGFDTTSDPDNCGSCGHSCEVSKPYGTRVSSPNGCVAGVCQFECLPNYYDRNGDLTTAGEAGNGCEDYCEISSPTELCDGLDNDCNGQVDEGFDTTSDPDNCGACGRSCDANKGANTAVVGCAASTCQYQCVSAQYVDLDGDISLGSAGTGCECHVTPEQCDGADDDCDGVVDNEGATCCTVYYKDADQDGFGDPNDSRCLCAPDLAARYTAPAAQATDCNDANPGIHPGATETCDNVDNDCDTEVDTNGSGQPLTRPCYTGPSGTAGVGPCVEGLQTCSAGTWSPSCVGEVTPEQEQCDSIDNDCDGSSDEGFDLTSDPDNCGSCGYRCSDHVPNAVSACQSSACVVVSCLPGYYDIDPIQPGCEYACTPQNGGVKTCGSPVDNDCNGLVDSTEFDVSTDPDHCGDCATSCEAIKPPGTQVQSPNGCVGGQCQVECAPGYHDVDGDLATQGVNGNGCECVETNGGVEQCDSIDNDCDGLVDETFDLMSDVQNCGSCGNACSALGDPSTVHAHLDGCVSGQCSFSCDSGYHDLDGDLNNGVPFGAGNNGCEYSCTITGSESCNGADDDCDGLVDEGSDGLPLRRSCYTGPAGTEANPPCQQGTETCDSATGSWGTCLGEVTPVPEVCGDGVDNDCNGTADDGFDFATDPNNCGSCNNSCVAAASIPANALPDSPACQAGACRFVCIAGFADLDGDLNSGNPPGPNNNGCEHTCDRWPTVAEECNGLDDDCDGQVDEGLPASQDICDQGVAGSPCDGVLATCRVGPGGVTSWWCDYPAGVETDSSNPNVVLSMETQCDGADGDCDGAVDDDFGVGDPCDNGALGSCRVTGTVVCDTVTSTKCNLPPPASWPQPADEVCNGQDDDCDGLTDESVVSNIPANDLPGSHAKWVVDDVVRVTRPDGNWSDVYVYEASRPSAAPGDPGAGSDVRACSQSGVAPWGFVTYHQAARACALAGMRLCRAEEFTEACDGQSTDLTYPYGNSYQAEFCNGAENSTGSGALLDTGALGQCISSGYGAYDLSGNLREWTDDLVGYSSHGEPIYRVRGGSYIDYEAGLACDFTSSSYVASAPVNHIGFRCCTSCGNGVQEAWEQCDGQAGCDPYLCVWSTCGNGTLDAGEECDDGNNLPSDGCAPDCTREQVCGDGHIVGGEECDDGNTTDGDGCDSYCQEEDGYYCFGEPSACFLLYEIDTSVSYSWIELAGTGSALYLSDDDNASISVGFSFPFYLTNYGTVYVGSNGFLSFGSGSNTYTNQCSLPSPTAPNNLIAIMWDDLNPASSDPVYYQSYATCPVGASGGACLVVQYDNYHHFGGGVAGTFEAILFDTGSILLQFQDSGAELGSGSTTGIEDSTGARGLTHVCNTASSLADGDVVCFSYLGNGC